MRPGAPSPLQDLPGSIGDAVIVDPYGDGDPTTLDFQAQASQEHSLQGRPT
jgi:hypothetical protein